jgi:enoyl-CoA hydratase/carnithine racemase
MNRGYTNLLVSLDDSGLCELRLNRRQHKQNAICESMRDELQGALGWAACCGEVSAVDISGEFGLVTEVCDDDKLSDRIRARAEVCLRRAPQAYGLSKRLLCMAADTDAHSALFGEVLAQSLLVGTQDHTGGVRARAERRNPAFTGR